jgi:cell wall-associated NlpC family hydrolase
MAIKVDGMKKKVKTAARDPIFIDEKAVGSEPVWDPVRALEFTDEEFDHHMRISLRYYNYFYTTKELKKYLVDWARNYDSAAHKFDKATLDKFAKASDSLLPLTPCALAKAHKQGMPLHERHVTYLVSSIRKVVDNLVDEAEVIDPTAPVVVKVTIQDRLNDILKTHILHFEELEDALIEGKTVDPKAYEYLTGKNVPQGMLSRIAAVFEKHQDEMNEARAGKDEQLNEGYAHYKAADYKRFDAFYTKLIADLTSYGQVKKATKKVTVRKPPAKEKLVAKLKYLKEEKTLRLVSVNPVDIVGATELWVYNVKTRKLGKYVAESMGGALTVKGTAIVGFDVSTSVQKTLRKPELQLKEFLAAGKIQLRKFIEDIKATEIKLTGRIGLDTILLKVQ